MLPICILAIRDDDDRAYMTRLFVKYQRLMYRTIYDILGDKWATEDVLQTTLLRLIDHLDTLRRLEPEGLAGYIAAACRHTAYNAVRDSGRHPWLPLDGGPEMSGRRWRTGCCAAWSWTPWPRCGPGWMRTPAGCWRPGISWTIRTGSWPGSWA